MPEIICEELTVNGEPYRFSTDKKFKEKPCLGVIEWGLFIHDKDGPWILDRDHCIKVPGC